MARISFILVVVGLCFTSWAAAATAPATQPGLPASPVYHIYAGNTHSHTAFTWPHGPQWVNAKADAGQAKEPGLYVDRDGAQHPAKNTGMWASRENGGWLTGTVLAVPLRKWQ
jgi:hypothetical protein